MKVRELMEREVTWIPAHVNINEASRILREHGISGAPVGDATGKIVGVISRTDLADGWELAETHRRFAFYRNERGELPPAGDDPVNVFSARKVEDVMMPLVFSVQADDLLGTAAALMNAEGIHRVIVLEGTDLVGILSASDVVGAVARGELVAWQ